MAILLHTPTNETVEVLDVFEAGGELLASVRALEGTPFVAGDKWPIRSEFATVKACELQALALFFRPAMLLIPQEA